MIIKNLFMTYEEYKALPKLVKIIDVEGCDGERKEMLGGIFEIHTDFYHNEKILVWNKDKSNYRTFNENQVQRMTPVKFNGEYIGIGDSFDCNDENKDKKTVRDYSFYDGEPRVLAVDKYDDDYFFNEDEIDNLTPLYPTNKIELTNEQLVEELEKRGLLENGKILKA